MTQQHTIASPHSRARIWRLSGLALFAIGAALCIAWAATLSRNAWAIPPGGPAHWPLYGCIHNGRLMVLSSVWAGGLTSVGWSYDVVGPRSQSWVPAFERIGDTYSGTPPFKSILYAASVPMWNIGLLSALLGWRAITRARRLTSLANRSACAHCGYPRAGLRDSPVCPECGL